MSILNTSQFQMLHTELSKSLEIKVLRALQKIKSKFEENEHRKLYPTGLRPGVFHGTPKVYKLQQQQ